MPFVPPPVNMEASLETVAAMLRQEGNGYQTRDFFSQHEGLPLDVDADCRSKMAAWCYQVVDFCSFNRESVEIAMNLLDRFLLTPSGIAVLKDRTLFQLASMTTLYTAIKINEPEAVDPATVSELSKGSFSAQDVEVMELHILNALEWRVNPPTSMSFVRSFLDMIPSYALPEPLRTTANDIAQFQTELAASTFDFIAVKRSTVAYCSLVNAFESMDMDEKVRNYIASMLAQVISLDPNAGHVRQIQASLLSAVLANEPHIAATLQQAAAAAAPVEFCKQAKRRASFDVSPRSTTADLR